jgi:membrane protein YdbS with pleckstrin-like domain
MFELKSIYRLPNSTYLYFLLRMTLFLLFFSIIIGIFVKSIFGVFIFLFIFIGISFSIDENTISINSGVIFKHSTSIAFNNIQNIDCAKGPLTGLFELSVLKIWTAASSQIIINQGKSKNNPDGLLILKSEAATWLKDFILNKHSVQQ